MKEIKCMDAAALSKKLCKHPIEVDLKYATSENFLGRPVEGYSADATHICLLTPKPAHALCEAQNHLIQNHHHRLLVLDAYRPLRAVQDFTRWMLAPSAGKVEEERKQIHYPHIEKNQLSDLGYVASSVSNHCFGHTVDTVLVSMETGETLEMGSVFDFFDERSHPTVPASEIGEKAYELRMELIHIMEKVGFKVAQTEYWHFEFNEKETNEPFDFKIVSSLSGVGC